VSDRDAFGNIINDPAAGATPAPAPAPAATLTPPLAPAPALTAALPRPTAPPAQVGGSWDLWDKAAGLFMVLLFVVPLGIGGWFAYTSIHDARSHAIDVPALMHTVTPATPRTRFAAPPKPIGLGFLRPTEVRRALAQHHGGVSVLRIDPLGVNFVSAPGTGTIAKSSVDAHAPQRLITAAAHRLHVSRKTINYVVLLKILGRPTWSAYFRNGAAFQADAHGHITRRIQ
jgi:hypothetical protein